MLGLYPHSGDRCSYSSYGVNRDRLFGTNALFRVASARWAAMNPLEEVLTQSSFVCFVVEGESNSEVLIRPSNEFGCFGSTLRKKVKCRVVRWCGDEENRDTVCDL